MKESYFISVINDISSLCSAVIANEGHISFDSVKTLDLEDLVTNSKEKQELKSYLTGLTDTTLNTICALMDFGRSHQIKILPINLTAKFNKLYLPEWFNRNDNKKDTVNYLAGKVRCLSRYLKRAEELLFYSKDKNINLTHNLCGGALIEQEGERYLFGDWTEEDEYDEQEYELHLKCLNCGEEVTEIVHRNYFRQQI